MVDGGAIWRALLRRHLAIDGGGGDGDGATENATLVTKLIVGLRERGLDVTRPVLVVIDESTALRVRYAMC